MRALAQHFATNDTQLASIALAGWSRAAKEARAEAALAVWLGGYAHGRRTC